MASGKTHDRATLAIAAALGTVAVTTPVPMAIAVGSLAGLLLSPDLDLSKCNARRRWGALGIIWEPYAAMLPHRSQASHAPIIGTLGRLAYLAAIGLPLPLLFPVTVPWHLWPTLAWFAVGLAIADIGHWLLDGRP